MKKMLLLFISLGLIFGCASTANKRSLKDLPKSDFSVEIPAGWWKPQYVNKYLITKDGPFLQYVLIQQRPIDRPFKNTKKKLRTLLNVLHAELKFLRSISQEKKIRRGNYLICVEHFMQRKIPY